MSTTMAKTSRNPENTGLSVHSHGIPQDIGGVLFGEKWLCHASMDIPA